MKKIILLFTTLFSLTSLASDTMLGEIRVFGGNFAPRGWAFCDGQVLPISSYPALYSILGTTYGGDGRTSFALPDLRSRLAVGAGQGTGLSTITQGQQFGVETNRLLGNSSLRNHYQQFDVIKYIENAPNNTSGVSTKKVLLYTDAKAFSEAQTLELGNNFQRLVTNLQPTLGVRYIISLQGIFPSRN